MNLNFTISSFPIAIIGAYLVAYLYIRIMEKQDDIRKFWQGKLLSAALIGIIVWKITPIMTSFNSILENPLNILFLPGGLPGVLGGIIAAVGVLAIASNEIKQRKGSRKPAFYSSLLGSGVFAILFIGISLTNNQTANLVAQNEDSIPTVLASNGLALTQQQLDAMNNPMPSLEGPQYSINSFKGKTLIVNVWATWCPPCRAEIPELRQAVAQLAGSNVIVVSIDLIESEKKGLTGLKDFIKKEKMNWLHLLDKGNQFSQAFEISSIPTTLVFDPKGNLVDRQLGAVNLEWLLKWKK